jgi:hypothetical protein
MLAVVILGNAKNLGFSPRILLTDDDGLIVYSIKVSRHSNRRRRIRRVVGSP